MIYTVRKWGNYGFINPLPTGILASTLSKYMSYKRQGAEFMPRPEWAIVKLYNVKKGCFPWGLRGVVYQILKKYCNELDPESSFKTFETIEEPQPFLESFNTLRDYQKEAVMSLIKNNGGILCMPTGSGKTKTAIEYLKIMRKKALIIVPTLYLKEQWEKQIEDLPYLKVLNHQSKECADLVKLSDIVVFDECHHLPARTIYKLAMSTKTDSLMVGLSATPTREDGETMRIFAAIGEIVFSVGRRELIEQGFLCDALVHYYKPIFDLKTDFSKTYAEIYDSQIVNNFSRNKLIVDKADYYAGKGFKVLVLITQIEHGQYIFDSLQHNNKVFLHGSSKKEEREQDLTQFNIIVASNIFNEGVNLPDLEVLIIGSGGKSSIQLTQRIGRVLRPKTNGKRALIIDFVDTPRYLKEHYRKRRGILEDEFEVLDYD